MSDITILNELIKDEAVIKITDEDGKNSVVLEESKAEQRVSIIDLPKCAIVIKADRFPAPDKIFKSSKGMRRRSDFIVIVNDGTKDWIVCIEMKRGTGDNPKIIEQLQGAQCLVHYTRAVGRIFWDKGDFLDEGRYANRFVSIKKLAHNNDLQGDPPIHLSMIVPATCSSSLRTRTCFSSNNWLSLRVWVVARIKQAGSGYANRALLWRWIAKYEEDACIDIAQRESAHYIDMKTRNRGIKTAAYIVPMIITLVMVLFNLTQSYNNLEKRIFDVLLRVRPEIPEDERILLLNIDDASITNLGVWPWSRNLIADALVVMHEFNTGFVVLDIEYTEASPQGINTEFLSNIPNDISEQLTTLQRNIDTLYQTAADDPEFISTATTTLITNANRQLVDLVGSIARDNDDYLGQAARIHGNVSFTVRLAPESSDDAPEALLEFTNERFAYDRVTMVTDRSWIVRQPSLFPTIMPIIRHGAGASFTNVDPDEDGIRRDVNLIMSYFKESSDNYYLQLGLEPLIRELGNPVIEINDNSLVLKNVQLKEDMPRDIHIPMTFEGEFLVNWPQTKFEQSFRHISFYELVIYQELERRLLDNLRVVKENGYLQVFDSDFDLIDAYDYTEQIKTETLVGGAINTMDDWRSIRSILFSEIDRFLYGTSEERLIVELDRLLASPDLTEEDLLSYTEIRAEIPDIFSRMGEVYERFIEQRDKLSAALNDAFVFIGYTGTGTTDIGITPFDQTYKNVGTHAAVVNTILQEQFLDWTPPWIMIALTILLGLGISTFLITRLNATQSILIGFGAMLFLLLFVVFFFVWTGIYLQLLTPVLATFFIFIANMIIKLVQTTRERSYIHDAFGRYLSGDVINDLLNDPTKLSLGGDKRILTAIFTDLKGFSTISEHLDPADLVTLLNSYLTTMSDQIIKQNGTVDKYEGDAIIAFFGAPIPSEDHAYQACMAASLMRDAERQINTYIVRDGLSPLPLTTRIGINTGEMIVGNMGTERKMDYTIMGNSVNLAARLEGVNKQYGTNVLVSDFTRTAAGEEFLYRSLDRVRVVGINTPVRIHELVGLKSLISAETQEMIALFQEGLLLFERQQWEQALRLFNQALRLAPDDHPSKIYQKRCTTYSMQQPDPSWDGVYNLSTK